MGKSLHEHRHCVSDCVAFRCAGIERLCRAEPVPAGMAPGAVWPQMLPQCRTVSAAARLPAAAWRAGICATTWLRAAATWLRAASARRVSASAWIGASARGAAALLSLLINSHQGAARFGAWIAFCQTCLPLPYFLSFRSAVWT
jgi:hypothetical protein